MNELLAAFAQRFDITKEFKLLEVAHHDTYLRFFLLPTSLQIKDRDKQKTFDNGRITDSM